MQYKTWYARRKILKFEKAFYDTNTHTNVKTERMD